MRRLRSGKWWASGARPGGYSVSRQPRAAISSASGGVLRAGRRGPGPHPTPRRSARLPASAPRCAAASTPRAMPETTATPAAASSRPEVLGDLAPVGASRAAHPTSATARPSGRVAAHEHAERRVRDGGEPRRKAGLAGRDPAPPQPRELALHRRHPVLERGPVSTAAVAVGIRVGDQLARRLARGAAARPDAQRRRPRRDATGNVVLLLAYNTWTLSGVLCG